MLLGRNINMSDFGLLLEVPMRLVLYPVFIPCDVSKIYEPPNSETDLGFGKEC